MIQVSENIMNNVLWPEYEKYSKLLREMVDEITDELIDKIYNDDKEEIVISGEIALKMVTMMRDMASRHQVLAITHLPQIAASGNEHYFVFKEQHDGRSVSKIKKLEVPERVQEIAKMIGGDHPSNAAIESATELLNR